VIWTTLDTLFLILIVVTALLLLVVFSQPTVGQGAPFTKHHTPQHTCYLITPGGGIVETRDEVCH
jgi:hypothetical protein